MIPERFVFPAALPKSSTSTVAGGNDFLSIMTHNVLLPNSCDAWWTYKMYDPAILPPPPINYCVVQNDDGIFRHDDITSWEYRRDLIQEKVRVMGPDIVCFQEVSPTSFEDDFKFMTDELGYDGVALYKKGRFRPATFWKTNEWTLVSPEVHKDRCLLTAFCRNKADGVSPVDDDTGDVTSTGANLKKKPDRNQRPWIVANCHLQAGKNGPRRVRQIQEAVKGALTLARKLKEPKPETSIRLVVCGDFNGGEESGAVRYLEDGYVDETWLEDNEPVTSNRKDLPLSHPLVDVSTTVAADGDERVYPPPTMVVQELMSILMDDVTYQNPTLNKSMKDRLERIYKSLATGDDGQMTQSDVEKWLLLINKRLGRGDEYRNCAIEMGYFDQSEDESESWDVRKKRIRIPEDSVLSLDGFISVYQKELDGGKFWGINHDMYVLGDPLPDKGLFASRYDRIYFNSQSIAPVAVVDTLSTKPCPNDEEPSDHLPVAAAFRAI
jgi:endonuclease/exonuclease/phosphatase family metal-dependent hydrolase